MPDKDIKASFTDFELRIAEAWGKEYGLTTEEVLIGSRLGVKVDQLAEQKQRKWTDRAKQIEERM